MESGSAQEYPFSHHPCWAECRKDLWERIHLPVARRCNVKCYFCDNSLGNSCHSSKPGSAASVLTPNVAIDKLREEIRVRPRLKIVGISGPGEPLANQETFEVIDYVSDRIPNIRLCVSTNGVLLADRVKELRRYNVETISVSVSTINPKTAQRIYEWAKIDGQILTGEPMAKKIIEKQLTGIQQAVKAGIRVKVNTILIPSVNVEEMEEISKKLYLLGVSLQNIVPLVPWAKMATFKKPESKLLIRARTIAGEYLRQFNHCHQCRSDVVGIPGNDTVF